MAVVEARFRVMASEALVVLVDPVKGAEDWVETRLRFLERRWSRFLSESDVSRVNSLGCTPGSWLSVAPETVSLIEVMQRGQIETQGRFDPTMLRALVDLGYGASIEDPTMISVVLDCPNTDHGVDSIRLDSERSRVWVPAGVALDPGGIGKGFAGDLVLADLLASGTKGALVSIGGDLAAGGEPPDRAGWCVSMEDPFAQGEELRRLIIDSGGIATSSKRSRRWRHDGKRHHHLLNPRTRGAAITNIASVTVVAASGWQAEVHASSAAVGDSVQALAYLDRQELAGLIVTDEQEVIVSQELAAMSIGKETVV